MDGQGRPLRVAGGDRLSARGGADLRHDGLAADPRLYDALLTLWRSPVVALNRTVALAEVAGPAAALSEVEALDRAGQLDGYH
ncbi:MAG TPA: hypothetical protein VFP89_12200 [Propionibacteriaceae bacterium]|nr:hypothetical protein [Propionibacteriaceae bacterium]